MAFEIIHRHKTANPIWRLLRRNWSVKRKPGHKQSNNPFFREFNVEVLLHLVGNPLA